VVLLAAAGLSVAAFPFRATWWGGWILAIGEAGIVGGLADWFAITALFRRPLGLPIPHTALIPANWESMAARVGAMVGGRVLTKEYVAHEVARFDVAAVIARMAGRVKPDDLASIVRSLARWVAEQLPLAPTADLVKWLQDLLLTRPAAPALATALDIAHSHGWDRRGIEAVASVLVDALDRPHVRAAISDLVDEVIGSYRQRMTGYPRLLIGLAELFGLIDRDRLVSALRRALQEIAEREDHPLRIRLAEAVENLPERLRRDPELAARIDALKDELIGSPVMARLIEGAANGLRRALAVELQDDHSEIVSWITSRLDDIRRALESDEALRYELDRWLKEHVTQLVERYHDRIAPFIERGVHALGPEGAVRLIEEHAGEDLQYIRVNGTVVGGLAGGVLYAVHLLVRLL
jgi:uncharacterized membrane-anchored protein YjiN (DUF445 family)